MTVQRRERALGQRQRHLPGRPPTSASARGNRPWPWATSTATASSTSGSRRAHYELGATTVAAVPVYSSYATCCSATATARSRRRVRPDSSATAITRPRVTVADFNGDGKLDFAMALDSRRSVRAVHCGPGLGTGTLGPAASFDGRLFLLESVAAGDMNGDGKVDLVTANSYGDDVSVLLGTGTGYLRSRSELRRRLATPLRRHGRLQRRRQDRPRDGQRRRRHRAARHRHRLASTAQ